MTSQQIIPQLNKSRCFMHFKNSCVIIGASRRSNTENKIKTILSLLTSDNGLLNGSTKVSVFDLI